LLLERQKQKFVEIKGTRHRRGSVTLFYELGVLTLVEANSNLSHQLL